MILALLCLLLPVPASAVPMVIPSVDSIPVGQTVEIDLILQPDDVVIGAFLLSFSVSSVSTLRIDAVGSGSLPGDCSGSHSGPSAQGDFSYGAECDSGFSSSIRVGTVTVSALVVGGELRIDLSNATDSESLEDVPIAPAVLSLVVIPEPRTIGLAAAGLLALAALRRRPAWLQRGARR
jgi:hypothetical protein